MAPWAIIAGALGPQRVTDALCRASPSGQNAVNGVCSPKTSSDHAPSWRVERPWGDSTHLAVLDKGNNTGDSSQCSTGGCSGHVTAG